MKRQRLTWFRYPASYVHAPTEALWEQMEYSDAVLRAQRARRDGDYRQCRRMLAHAAALRLTYWPQTSAA